VSATHRFSVYDWGAMAYVQTSRLKAVAVVYEQLLNSQSPEALLVTFYIWEIVMTSEQELVELEQRILKSEIRAYNLEQYLVLLPAFIIILTDLNAYILVLPVLIGIVLDYYVALSKTSWLKTSMFTLPLCVGIYWGIGKAFAYISVSIPSTNYFSLETILFALISSRFVLSFFSNSGIAMNYIDLKIKTNGQPNSSI
jgi:hypothetical protein